MSSLRIISSLALFAIVAFWGATFELVQRATEAYPVMAFLAWRFLVASIAFLALAALRPICWKSIGMGALIGQVLALSYVFQTFSLQETDSTQTGIITGMFILFVPIFGWIMFGTQVSRWLWLGLACSLLGLACLMGGNVWQVERGSLLALLCAMMYGLHVTLVDYSVQKNQIVSLTMGQLLAATVVFWLSWSYFLVDGTATSQFFPPRNIWWILLTTGIFGSALAFGIQTFSQRHLSAIEAGVIIMTEPVFAAVFGWIFGERLTSLQWLGATIMIASIFVVGLAPSSDDDESIIPAAAECSSGE